VRVLAKEDRVEEQWPPVHQIFKPDIFDHVRKSAKHHPDPQKAILNAGTFLSTLIYFGRAEFFG
jgi:hypothetical protein